MSTKAWDRGSRPSVLRGLFTRRQPDPQHQNPTGPAALLWDMDGLLVDSEPIWTIAERELFAGWGVEFTADMKADMVGGRLDVSVPKMIAFGGPAAEHSDIGGVQNWLLDRMTTLFAADVPVMPGAQALYSETAAAGIPQALVSSSYRVLVDAVLRGLPGHPFTVSVAGDEVTRAKPDPEPYLTAARRLGVPITSCVVLEDTATGARAGANAGAQVVYCPSVPGSGPAEANWRQIDSLRDVSWAGLRAWHH